MGMVEMGRSGLFRSDVNMFKEGKIMRHIVIRLSVGIIWLVAAVASCVQGSYLFAGGYAVLGIAFLLSAYMGWKKEKDKRG